VHPCCCHPAAVGAAKRTASAGMTDCSSDAHLSLTAASKACMVSVRAGSGCDDRPDAQQLCTTPLAGSSIGTTSCVVWDKFWMAVCEHFEDGHPAHTRTRWRCATQLQACNQVSTAIACDLSYCTARRIEAEHLLQHHWRDLYPEAQRVQHMAQPTARRRKWDVADVTTGAVAPAAAAPLANPQAAMLAQAQAQAQALAAMYGATGKPQVCKQTPSTLAPPPPPPLPMRARSSSPAHTPTMSHCHL
jgi:hypothetical protein